MIVREECVGSIRAAEAISPRIHLLYAFHGKAEALNRLSVLVGTTNEEQVKHDWKASSLEYDPRSSHLVRGYDLYSATSLEGTEPGAYLGKMWVEEVAIDV